MTSMLAQYLLFLNAKGDSYANVDYYLSYL